MVIGGDGWETERREGEGEPCHYRGRETDSREGEPCHYRSWKLVVFTL